MSFADEYRDRRQRQRREGVRWVAYLIRVVVSSAIILVISFALDVPQKLQQKVEAWRQPAQTELQANEQGPARPENVQVTDDQAAEQREQEVAEQQRRREARRRTTDQQALAEPAFAPEEEPPEASTTGTARERRPGLESLLETTPTIDEQAGQKVVLDLSKRVTRLPLDELFPDAGDEPRVKILALRDTTLRYELDPSDGILHSQQMVYLKFPDHPHVRIQFELSRAGNRRLLRVKPQMALGSSKPVPLTLSSVKRVALETRRRVGAMVSQLSQAEREKESLDTWLKAPVGRTLQARGEARTRLLVLNNQIPKMEAAVAEGKQDLAVVEALEELVSQLHEVAVIQIDTVGGDDDSPR